MPLEFSAMIDSIVEHSEGTAQVALGRLGAPIEHCPGWTMQDLLDHLVQVQRFWATIVEEGLTEPPDLDPPPRASGPELIERFLLGARRLTEVLARADQGREVWTWAPGQRDVAFVTRHQVQEILVHHWDAAHAAGVVVEFDPAVASDSIDEFLTFSVSSDIDPADPPRPELGGTLALVCTDVARSWTVRDGSTSGTVAVSDGAEGASAQMSATSTQLLLWLYSRVRAPSDEDATRLGERLRALTFTD